MLKTRVIPCLLLQDEGLVKTVKFKNPCYIGDPINCIKIFNEKEVDELILLDISASPAARGPNFALLEEIASECFMPLCYGGGITTIEQIATLFKLGIEKICLNDIVYSNPDLVTQAAQRFGSQSIAVAMDINKTLLGGYQLSSLSQSKIHKVDVVHHLQAVVQLGAGEVLINCIHRDGTMKGFDLTLLKDLTSKIHVPLVACGGAGELSHIAEAIHQAGVDAVAIGSMFVFHGKHKGVLINVPSYSELASLQLG